jgi:hypothetical protein
MDDLIWYAAYGSNMHADRFGYYLKGGTPPGSRRTYPGCRDPHEPRRTLPVMMPGGIYFGLESPAWTGGMAMYDPALPDEAAARAYLITRGQFSDLAAQEMYRDPGVDLEVFEDVIAHGRVRLGDGRYETLVYVGELDGRSLITFTAPWGSADIELNPPAAPYLVMLATGLHESHRWNAEQIATYLGKRPGVAGFWTPSDVEDLVRAAL